MRCLLTDARVDPNAADAASRTPLFYAHTPLAVAALTEHAATNLNVLDDSSPPRTAVTLRFVSPPIPAPAVAPPGADVKQLSLSTYQQVAHIVCDRRYAHEMLVGASGTAVFISVWDAAVVAGLEDVASLCFSAKWARTLAPDMTTQQALAAAKAFEVRFGEPGS